MDTEEIEKPVIIPDDDLGDSEVDDKVVLINEDGTSQVLEDELEKEVIVDYGQSEIIPVYDTEEIIPDYNFNFEDENVVLETDEVDLSLESLENNKSIEEETNDLVEGNVVEENFKDFSADATLIKEIEDNIALKEEMKKEEIEEVTEVSEADLGISNVENNDLVQEVNETLESEKKPSKKVKKEKVKKERIEIDLGNKVFCSTGKFILIVLSAITLLTVFNEFLMSSLLKPMLFANYNVVVSLVALLLVGIIISFIFWKASVKFSIENKYIKYNDIPLITNVFAIFSVLMTFVIFLISYYGVNNVSLTGYVNQDIVILVLNSLIKLCVDVAIIKMLISHDLEKNSN